MTAPTWLLDRLIAAGHVTETGATRRAKARRCRSCRTQILVGMSDPASCAYEIQADPAPLTALGEALAIIGGHRTYAMHREGDRFVLDPRDASEIAFHPAGGRPREDVLRDHRCHTAQVAGPLTAPSSFAETAPRLPADAPAPF